MKRLAAALLALALAASAQAAGPPLRLLIWSDYLPPGTLEAFTAATGIPVVLDSYDDAEAVEVELLAGSADYDLAVVSSEYLGRLIAARALRPLDPAMRPHIEALDPGVMAWLDGPDPGNRHAVPYLWGTTGIGYDRAAVAARLPGVAIDSWRVLFDPAHIARLADCGVMLVDSVEDAVAAALLWLGHAPDSAPPAARLAALDTIAAIAPHVRRFGSNLIGPLSEGEVCLVLGWSVDVLAAAAKAGPARDIGYVIPREGAALWIDSFVLPARAANVDAAQQFIAWLLAPEANAAAASYNWGAGAVPEARALMDPAVRDSPQVLPDPATFARLVLLRSVTDAQKAEMLHLWTDLKFGAEPPLRPRDGGG